MPKNNYLIDPNIKKIIVRLHQTINDALKSLAHSSAKICIVLDNNNFFKGVLNDGDIRRALINGANLKTKIIYVYNKKSLVLKENFNKNIAIQKFKKKDIDQAPIVKNKRVIGIFRNNKFLFQNLKIPAVIMSGGLGSRLGKITKKIPKALVSIKKTPMLSIVINNLKKYGFKNFILTTYFKSNLIKDYYKNGKIFDVKIKYVTEKKPLGTAGSMSLLTNKIKEKNFLLTNCDVLTEMNYKTLLEFHIKHKADLTVAVKKYTTENQYGEIDLKGIKINKIIEKPKKNIIINSGVYILKTKNIEYLKQNHHADMNDFIMKLIKKKKKIIAFPFYENWFDLGTKEQLKIYKNNF